MRCDHCGVEQRHVLGTTNTHCAPPFERQRHAFTGKHPADRRCECDPEIVRTAGHGILCPKHVAPLDTSTLGPIRIDPNSDAEKARLVRDVLYPMADEAEQDRRYGTAEAFRHIAQHASDAELCKLRRFIRG